MLYVTTAIVPGMIATISASWITFLPPFGIANSMSTLDWSRPPLPYGLARIGVGVGDDSTFRFAAGW